MATKKALRKQQLRIRKTRQEMNRLSQLTEDAATALGCGRDGQRVSPQRREVERYDNFKRLANEHVTKGGEWAGAPFPIHELSLVIEKRYPFQALNGMSLKNMTGGRKAEDDKPVDWKLRNRWICELRGVEVFIWEESDGRITKSVLPIRAGHRIDMWMNTLATYEAWTVAGEVRAMSKLRGLIKPHLYDMYFLTGMFLETSKRTGITYLFRKLRPTIALRKGAFPNRSPDVGDAPPLDAMRIMAALCLHPIGFYERSWGGVMVPTDDVMAHLLLMRGDEALFWRKANKHRPDSAEAGI